MDCKSKSTEELEAICRADIEADPGMSWEELDPILTELACRRRESNPNAKTAEQAWEEFQEHYLPEIDPTTGVMLTPSWHGELCAGNGQGPEECCCDECDYYQVCFPDWKE